MLPNSVSCCRAKPFKVSAAAPRPREKGRFRVAMFVLRSSSNSYPLLRAARCALRAENIFVCWCCVGSDRAAGVGVSLGTLDLVRVDGWPCRIMFRPNFFILLALDILAFKNNRTEALAALGTTVESCDPARAGGDALPVIMSIIRSSRTPRLPQL